jgi:c-di-GMP-binding flagellar brake protein YcgR
MTGGILRTFEDQHLAILTSKVGQLIMEIGINEGKFKSVFIGFLPQKFILIQMPDVNKDFKVLDYIKDSMGCTIRGLVEGHEGAVIAFITTILSTMKKPTQMLVLDIPKKIELQQLRKVTRVDTNIKLSPQINNRPWNGVVENLSAGGCLLKLDKEKDLIVKEGEIITLNISDMNVGKFDPVNGTVCNIKKHPRSIHLGLEFDETATLTIIQVLQKVLFV